MEAVKSIDPNSIPTPERHALLLAAVAPRPIAFASTIDKAGNVNLSPFSFFNVFSSNPPIMIFSPARRGRDKTNKHSYDNVKEVPEVVINIVNYPMVEQMSLASTEYEKGVNEFLKAGFTQIESEKVLPPRVGEAPAAFECQVERVIELGEEGGAGNLVVCKVLMMHFQEKYLDEAGKLDTTKLDLVGRMGANWYNRASGDSLFEIPKPLRRKGIGVDNLPSYIRDSTILTGNNLGRLGNVERLPTEAEIKIIRNDEIIKFALNNFQEGGSTSRVERVHKLAKDYVEQGDVEKALALLMAFS